VAFEVLRGGGTRGARLTDAAIEVLRTNVAGGGDPSTYVWPFEPSWDHPVIERYGFKTDLRGPARDGTEQRALLRETPSGSIAFTSILSEREMAHASVLIYGAKYRRFTVPLWQHRTPLLAEAAYGSAYLAIETATRPFRSGERVCLWRDSFTFETAVVDSVLPNGLTLSQPLSRTWPAGVTAVVPVTIGMLPDDAALDWLGLAAGQIDVEFAVPAFYSMTLSPMPKIGGYSVIWLFDPHIRQTSAAARVRACLAWAVAQAENPAALVVGGDMLDGGYGTGANFKTWVRDPAGGNLPSLIPIVPCAGNWDTEEEWLVPDEGTSPDPFVTLKANYPDLFGASTWYTWDHESLRIIIVNNLSDYFDQTNQRTAYANCNPPGYRNQVNPDFAGITIPGSPQRLWLDSVSGSSHLWKIVVAHRGLWAPFDSDPRKLNRDARVPILAAITNGVSQVSTGDIHVAFHAGPVNGAHIFGLAGGYAGRDIDLQVLADDGVPCLWAQGKDGDWDRVQIATQYFDGDASYLTVFEVSDDTPAGAVVYAATLNRNA
jgi:hypothetical protein